MLNRLFKAALVGIGAYLFALQIGEFDTGSAAAYGAFIGAIIFVLGEKVEEETEEGNDEQP